MLHGAGFRRGGYECQCREGYYLPDADQHTTHPQHGKQQHAQHGTHQKAQHGMQLHTQHALHGTELEEYDNGTHGSDIDKLCKTVYVVHSTQTTQLLVQSRSEIQLMCTR